MFIYTTRLSNKEVQSALHHNKYKMYSHQLWKTQQALHLVKCRNKNNQ